MTQGELLRAIEQELLQFEHRFTKRMDGLFDRLERRLDRHAGIIARIEQNRRTTSSKYPASLFETEGNLTCLPGVSLARVRRPHPKPARQRVVRAGGNVLVFSGNGRARP